MPHSTPTNSQIVFWRCIAQGITDTYKVLRVAGWWDTVSLPRRKEQSHTVLSKLMTRQSNENKNSTFTTLSQETTEGRDP